MVVGQRMRSPAVASAWLLGVIGLCRPVAGDWPAGFEALRRQDCSAIQELADVVQSNQNFAHGHYLLGLAHSQCGCPEEAVADLGKAVQLEQQSTLYRLALVRILLDLERFDDAYVTLRTLQVTAIEDEYRSQYVLLLSRAARTEERSEVAIRELRSRLKNRPEEHRLYHALGIAHDRRGEHQAAWRSFEKAFALDRENLTTGLAAARAAVVYARSLAAGKQQRALYASAARIAEQLVELQPTFEHIMLAGETWLFAGKHQTAQVWLDRALERKPRNPVVFLRLGQCRVAAGDFPGALSQLQEALKSGVGSGKLRREVYDELGGVYLHLRRYLLAISAFRESENEKMLAEAIRLAELAGIVTPAVAQPPTHTDPPPPPRPPPGPPAG